MYYDDWKPGDRVVCLDTLGAAGWLNLGEEYIIHSIHLKNGTDIILKGQVMSWMKKRFRRVRKNAESFVLILKESGVLKPSLEPKVYVSEKQAKFVAQEMAAKHPGSTFIIFKAYGEASAPQPTAEVTVYG
jgi:hypothetical protein